jgi:cupin 2 domain-containing protein
LRRIEQKHRRLYVPNERMTESGNLFADIPRVLENEQFLDLFSAPGVKIERIVSAGQTPTLRWLEQDWTEWVALLAGTAAIQIEGEASPRTLAAGDWLLIPAQKRHRVEWTDPGRETVWLAVLVGIR